VAALALATPLTLLALWMGMTGEGTLAIAAVAVFVPVFVAIVLPIAYIVSFALWTLARVTSVSPSSLSQGAVYGSALGATLAVCYVLWWHARPHGEPWAPLMSIPGALGGAWAFVRISRGGRRRAS
jgi:hypothetical protein